MLIQTSYRVLDSLLHPTHAGLFIFRLYSSRKEEKPVIVEKPSNFYKTVSESKEVTKMYSMLSGCMQGIKMEFTDFIKSWNR